MIITIEFDENQCRSNTKEQLDEIAQELIEMFAREEINASVKGILGPALRQIEDIRFIRKEYIDDEE